MRTRSTLGWSQSKIFLVTFTFMQPYRKNQTLCWSLCIADIWYIIYKNTASNSFNVV